jgi:hypothetical protein
MGTVDKVKETAKLNHLASQKQAYDILRITQTRVECFGPYPANPYVQVPSVSVTTLRSC